LEYHQNSLPDLRLNPHCSSFFIQKILHLFHPNLKIARRCWAKIPSFLDKNSQPRHITSIHAEGHNVSIQMHQLPLEAKQGLGFWQGTFPAGKKIARKRGGKSDF